VQVVFEMENGTVCGNATRDICVAIHLHGRTIFAVFFSVLLRTHHLLFFCFSSLSAFPSTVGLH